MTPALLLAVAAPFAATMSYDQFAGLTVDVSGARLVSGSSFQYYEPGWKGGIYASRWQPKTVTTNDDTITVRYQGKDRNVLGTIVYTLEGDALTAKYDFAWNGERTVCIENTFGLLWASAFKDARAESSNLRRSRFSFVPGVEDGVASRSIAVDTRALSFVAPFGRLSVASEVPFTVYDARNLPQDWARGKPVHWMGVLDHTIKPRSRLSYSVTLRLSQILDRPPMTETVSGVGARLERARAPQAPLPVLPKPHSLDVGTDASPMSGTFRLVGASDPSVQWCEGVLNGRMRTLWQVESTDPVEVHVSLTGGAVAGLYSMTCLDGRVEINATDGDALTTAVLRLASLVRSDGTRLILPDFEIRYDRPTTEWRGVHMFVGPKALEFQTSLMDRMLLPLRFNRVVLQCERTAWDALPGIETRSTMSKLDLKSLFDAYRERAIDPIPLVQSLGHMEWMFANGRYTSLAVNPEVPYTLDARKVEAREAMIGVWEEALALLKPKTVHFGLDEFDSRGFPHDPTLATRLWSLQVPILMDFAKQNGVTPMLWGDAMLAPSEGNDATNAPTADQARERRALVPRDALIGDWHYTNDSRASVFTSLAHWSKLGHRPIATGWSKPNNVFGLSQAAIKNKAGYLQTTWAGHESSEANAVREIDQIAAYVLAADYAWGAQKAKPSELPYDYKETARRMLFDPPQPVAVQGGVSLLANDGDEFDIGQFRFRGGRLFELRSVVSERAARAPTSFVVNVNRSARGIAVAVDCFAWMEFGADVATVIVRLADGSTRTLKLRYGIEVRAGDDPNMTATGRAEGVSVVFIDLGKVPLLVKAIEFHRNDAAAGLRVHGITVI